MRIHAGSSVAVLGLLLLSACRPWPDAAPAGRPAPAPATFADVSALAGLDQAPADRVLPAGECRLDPARVVSGFGLTLPPVDPASPQVADLAPHPCLAERATGGAAAADLVGDPRPDLVLTRLDGPPLLLRNDGGFRFTDLSDEAGFGMVDEPTNGAAVADVDNDGDRDVVFTVVGGRAAVLLINDGAGRFTDQAADRGIALEDGFPHAGSGAVFGDVDADGWVDLHLTEFRPAGLVPDTRTSHARLLRNLGAAGRPGVFEDVTAAAGVALEQPNLPLLASSSLFGDFDADGDLDLAVAAATGSRMFWSRGDGTFSSRPLAAGPATGLAAGDLDGDGRPELLVTSAAPAAGCGEPTGRPLPGNRLFGFADGQLTAERTDLAGVRDGGWGWGAAFADLTNSGALDAVAASGTGADDLWPLWGCWAEGPLRLWRNDGSGVLVEAAASSGLGDPAPTRAVVVFDADGDGRLDLLVTRAGAPPRLYANTSPDVGEWVAFLVRTRSGGDALGASVQVTAREGDRPQVRRVGPSGSFLASGDPFAHVGLGDHRGRVHLVEIRFPSGARVELRDVEPGQVVVVEEPAG